MSCNDIKSEPQRRVRINGYRRGDWKKVATLINQDNANSREKKGVNKRQKSKSERGRKEWRTNVPERVKH